MSLPNPAQHSSGALAAGARVGPYEIVGLLAQGGMGAVYEARNVVTQSLRALKVVRPELVGTSDFVERFLREVRIASSIRHPNLVETLDPFEVDGALVLPMELLRGETLSAYLKRAGALPPSEVADILGPACDAIQAVHERGIIHRDLKPLNIFLAETGGRRIPKVLDFGAAREVHDDEQTRTGLVVGSSFYMAPEQAEGRRDLDPRVDVYALGVIAYQCVTGRRPYDTTEASSALVKLIRNEPFARPREIVPGLAPEVENVILEALAWRPQDRFASVAELAASLRRVAHSSVITDPESTRIVEPTRTIEAGGEVADSGVRSSTSSPVASATPGPQFVAPPMERTSQRVRPGRARALLAGVLVLACSIAAVVWWSQRRPSAEGISSASSGTSVPVIDVSHGPSAPPAASPSQALAEPLPTPPAPEPPAIAESDSVRDSARSDRADEPSAAVEPSGHEGVTEAPPPRSRRPERASRPRCGAETGIPCLD